MNRKFAIAAGLSVVLALASIPSVMAYGPSNQAIPGSERTLKLALRPPTGFLEFCVRNANQCRPSKDATLPFSAELLNTLRQVNTAVNRSIRPVDDGRRDVWSMNVTEGDCEDYVLTKRARLMKAGIPSGALRIAYTKTWRGEGHAILIVKTNKGDLVLDNLNQTVKTLGDTGYRIVSMSTANPLLWG